MGTESEKSQQVFINGYPYIRESLLVSPGIWGMNLVKVKRPSGEQDVIAALPTREQATQVVVTLRDTHGVKFVISPNGEIGVAVRKSKSRKGGAA